MYRKFTFLLIFLLLSSTTFSQNSSAETWERILNSIQLDKESLYKDCPNFPILDEFKGQQSDFNKALSSWQANYPAEVNVFWNIEKVVDGNPSHYYLGLKEKPVQNFEYRWWQWIEASGITSARLNEICPNLPIPKSFQNTQSNFETYENEFTLWSYIYPLEYEALINAEELTKVNRFYEDYVVASITPKFIGARILPEKPKRPSGDISFEEELKYQLSLQNWIFVFENENFENVYGFYPRFLENFDQENYIKIFKEGAEIAAENIKNQTK